VIIRHADPARDAGACADVYAPYVRDSVASFEARPPDTEELQRRIERITQYYPWLVAEADEAGGDVVGYAYAAEHRDRAAYRWAADVTVYISPDHQRRGLGRALYGALFELMVRQGLQVACAGITLPNDASVGLHEACGFELVGTYPRIGWKAGRWWDVSWWERELVERSEEPPPEPGPPVTLEEPVSL
jgi:phosphinothricin acetyltransferase